MIIGRLGGWAYAAWSNGRLVALLALVLFIGACATWSANDPDSADSLFLMLMVPIALCAFRFEVTVGAIAGLAAFAVVAGWDLYGGLSIRPVEFVRAMIVLVMLGCLAGISLARRKRLEEKLTTYHEISLDLHCTASFEGYFTQLNPS